MPHPPDLSDASDHDIVELAREGDPAAQREIVRRYAPTVYDRIYRMVGHHELAEDLTQDTFAKAFQALAAHGPARKPAAWLGQIAKNTALDYVRRNRPDSTRSPLTVTPGHADLRATYIHLLQDTPTPDPDLQEFAAALELALQQLRPEYRRCFILRYIERRSAREVAKMLGLPLGTVKSHLHRATEELRQTLRPLLSAAPADPGRTT
jgi:RNA polymerase sigma-70 factor (ECF subfamily)